MNVNTVLGEVSPADLGWTLPHEHLLIDIYVRFQPHREYMLFDVDLACAELAPFAAAGGTTLVNVTTNEIGRSPLKLREIATRTGVNIVMGTGRYREPFYEPDAVEETDTGDRRGVHPRHRSRCRGRHQGRDHRRDRGP